VAKRSRKNRQNTNYAKQSRLLISKTLVDVCIPVHGRFDLVKSCLDSLPYAFGNIPYKVIINDNASDKVEADTFYAQYPDVSVIRNRENLGFPASCNKMFRHGGSPLVFFLNDDTTLFPDSMKHLVSAMDDPKVGVAGMKLIFPDAPEVTSRNPQAVGKIQHIGLMTNINMDVYHQFLGWSADNPRVNAVRNVYMVTGAALMTRRNLFADAGMFFEGYSVGTYEDCDLCMAIREMGYNVIVEPKAVGTHIAGATANTIKRGYPLTQNKEMFVSRWRHRLTWTAWWY